MRIEVDGPAEIAMLEHRGIEPWPDHPRAPSVLARVPADARAWLDASGRAYEVIVGDLQVAIEAERDRLALRTEAAGTAVMFEEFRDLDEIDEHLDALATDAPELATIVQLGTSLEGRPIRGLRIERLSSEPKPLVVVNATQHAREWIAAMSTLFVADALVTAAPGDDAGIDALLDEVAVLVIPVVNPDGYVHTWLEDRFWRKNRRDDHGVDLNRNFTVAWGAEGASGDPTKGNYRGAAPLSEPEAVALASLLEAEPSIAAVLDVHSYGQLVLAPWSFTVDPPPADDVLAPLGETIAETMAQPWHTEYVPQQAADLYLAAGTWPDHAYGVHGVLAYTLELRPDEAEIFAAGFVLPADDIAECGEEVLGALQSLSAFVADAPGLEPGDDGDAPGPVDADGSSGGGSDGSSGASGPADPEPPEDSGDASSGFGGGEMTDEDDPRSGARIEEVSSACACGPTGRDPPGWAWLVALGGVASRTGRRPRPRRSTRSRSAKTRNSSGAGTRPS